MLPQLGFSLEMEYDRPIAQVIALLQKAGFSAVSPLWGQDLAAICACGITVQSLHAPPKGMAMLWQPDTAESVPLQKSMLDSLSACARWDIPVLVVHGWQGMPYTFPGAPLDFSFWDRFVEHAQALGVAIAFENLEGEEYLAALLARYAGLSHIGFCWDSGHDRCYPHKLDFLKAFGDRLIMTHLNDNFGRQGDCYNSKDDRHLLPFDGNTDWDKQLGRLKTAKPQSILNFELKTLSHGIATYPQWTLEQFITEAGIRARQIAEKYAMCLPSNI